MLMFTTDTVVQPIRGLLVFVNTVLAIVDFGVLLGKNVGNAEMKIIRSHRYLVFYCTGRR